jgi:hypothetical protein
MYLLDRIGKQGFKLETGPFNAGFKTGAKQKPLVQHVEQQKTITQASMNSYCKYYITAERLT